MTVTDRSGYVFALTGVARRTSTGTGHLIAPSSRWALGLMAPTAKAAKIDGNGTFAITGDVLIASTTPPWAEMKGSAIMTMSGAAIQAAKDPLASVAQPSVSGLPVFTDGAYHGPGVYRDKTLSISSPLVMAAGNYIVEDGITLTSTITGTGVFIFNGCATGSPASCKNDKDVQLNGTSIGLTPPSTGTYAGLLLFQSRTNAHAMNLTGNTTVMSLDGVIYAVAADVKLTGTVGMVLGGLIARTVDITGNGLIRVG